MYDWVSSKLKIEADYFISKEMVDLDKEREARGEDREYPTFTHSIDLQQVDVVKYKGKNYLMRKTSMAVPGLIPLLHSGRS